MVARGQWVAAEASPAPSLAVTSTLLCNPNVPSYPGVYRKKGTEAYNTHACALGHPVCEMARTPLPG